MENPSIENPCIIVGYVKDYFVVVDTVKMQWAFAEQTQLDLHKVAKFFSTPVINCCRDSSGLYHDILLYSLDTKDRYRFEYYNFDTHNFEALYVIPYDLFTDYCQDDENIISLIVLYGSDVYDYIIDSITSETTMSSLSLKHKYRIKGSENWGFNT